MRTKSRQSACRCCRPLPAWFGIPESVAEYAAGCRQLPLWTAQDGRRAAAGLCGAAAHQPLAAELYVMGVLPGSHRQGVGRALFAALRDHARRTGCEYLQVKTVAEGHYPQYDRTNAFYRAMGFRELKCCRCGMRTTPASCT